MFGRIITLTTDFGARDGFVAAMKGVVLSIAPSARIIDVSHEIDFGDILGASFVLHNAARYFPAGAIHVAVVDPGVGSARRPIAVEANDSFFIGPDNGILTPWLDAGKTYHLDNPKYFLDVVSRTFHGRDVFAPVAAHIANGTKLASMGSRIEDPVRLPWPKPLADGDTIRGEVVRVDKFGNLITNIPGDVGDCEITIGRRKIVGLSECYAVGGKKLIALIGSHGNIEIATTNGSAADVAKAGRGDVVVVRRGAKKAKTLASGRDSRGRRCRRE